MSATTPMRQQRPLSPPPSSDEGYSLQHIARYNSTMHTYPPYVTPPQQSMYGDPSNYHTAQNGYHAVEQQQPRFYRDPYDSNMASRGPRQLGSPMRPGQPHPSDRRSKSPKPPKKTRKAVSTKPKTEVINGPLSEVTKDYPVPVKNMEEWVNRSAEVRHKEAEKKGGYIARPMNSFMLYRSAYAERIKIFCKENNHQVVSQVSGASWPQEPKEIRDRYEKYASLERENHQKAHPDYKFAPNKNANTKKRKGWDSDDESEDPEDPDWRSGRSGSSKRARSDRNSARTTPFDSKPIHPMPSFHPSSWDATNPGRPVPQMMAVSDIHGQYYQSRANQYIPQVEDVTMRKTIMPSGRVGTPLVGMPGGTQQELLRTQSHLSTPIAGEGQLDPSLLYSEDQSHYGPPDEYVPATNYQYGSNNGPVAGDYHQYDTAQNFHPGMQTLTDGRETWSAGMPGADFDQELNRYF